jgi:hypothetical protein
MHRRQPAAEQAAHPTSGPRRRPRKLPESFVTQGDFGRTTHINCSPIFPARFRMLTRGRSIAIGSQAPDVTPWKRPMDTTPLRKP